MRHVITLMVENCRRPDTYQAFHYVGDRPAKNWFLLPVNFVDAVKVIETNEFRIIKNLTTEEIVYNGIETWVQVFFNADNEFHAVHTLVSSV